MEVRSQLPARAAVPPPQVLACARSAPQDFGPQKVQQRALHVLVADFRPPVVALRCHVSCGARAPWGTVRLPGALLPQIVSARRVLWEKWKEKGHGLLLMIARLVPH